MTIDEIKVRLINIMKPIRINLMGTEIKVRQEEQYPYLEPIFEALKCAIDCLDELEWYRNQDLIPRKDALVRTAQAVSPDDIYTKIFITLKQIPKAEYKGDEQ